MARDETGITSRSLTPRAKRGIAHFFGLTGRGLDLSRELKSEWPHDAEKPLDPRRFLRRQALADLKDKDLDRRAVAARSIVDLIGGMAELENLRLHSHLVIPLADSLYVLFESQEWKSESVWHGREYFPPNERLKGLLLGGLHAFDPTIEDSFEAASLLLRHGKLDRNFEAAVWLGKRAPGYIDQLERLISDSRTRNRVCAAAALVEFGHSRRPDAERALLQAADDSYFDGRNGGWRLIRLIARKLGTPESFLLALCRQEKGYNGSFLVLEIIRRRGPGVLPELQRVRSLSQGDHLAWALYHALDELEGLYWEWKEEEAREVEFSDFLADSPDLAWQSLMERLERILKEVG